MPDNVAYTPGSGATIAADEISGVLYQRVKPVIGVDGQASDVSDVNPMPVAGYGELIEAIQALRITLGSMMMMMPRLDSSQRIRSNVETGSVSVSGSITASGVTNFGTRSSDYTVQLINSTSCDNLRRNIQVT